MLSPEESKNCKDLLRILPSSDILSLCETVTNRLVAPTTSAEAIDAIVLYTKSPEELLGRKKVKSDGLFQYLQSLKASGVTPKSSKTELISKILNLWKGSSTSLTSNVSQMRSDPIQVFHTEINNYTIIQNREDDGGKIALEFINWFYPMLNGLRVLIFGDRHLTLKLPETYPGYWGPQHFWPDTRLTFCAMTDAAEIIQEEFEDSEGVTEKLSSLILQEKVILNPNTTQDGFRGIISPEGLAKVAVCGTLERDDTGSFQRVVGVFEQCFGLLRDVNDNNRWKIKQCKLQIRVAGSRWQPSNISLTEDTIKSLDN